MSFAFSSVRVVASSLLLMGSLLLSSPSFAKEKPAKEKPAKDGFDAFSLLKKRRIFDPNRQPGRTPKESEDSSDLTGNWVLTGILIQGEKALAFFTEIKTQRSQVLKVHGSLSGAEVTSIQQNQIELVREGSAITLKIGKVLPLQNGVTPEDPPARVERSSAAALEEKGPSGTPEPSEESDDAVRKMMEKRRNELAE